MCETWLYQSLLRALFYTHFVRQSRINLMPSKSVLHCLQQGEKSCWTKPDGMDTNVGVTLLIVYSFLFINWYKFSYLFRSLAYINLMIKAGNTIAVHDILSPGLWLASLDSVSHHGRTQILMMMRPKIIVLINFTSWLHSSCDMQNAKMLLRQILTITFGGCYMRTSILKRENWSMTGVEDFSRVERSVETSYYTIILFQSLHGITAKRYNSRVKLCSSSKYKQNSTRKFINAKVSISYLKCSIVYIHTLHLISKRNHATTLRVNTVMK